MSVVGHDINRLGTASPSVPEISDDLVFTKEFLEDNSWHQARNLHKARKLNLAQLALRCVAVHRRWSPDQFTVPEAHSPSSGGGNMTCLLERNKISLYV